MTQISLLRLHCKLYDFVTAKKLADKIFDEFKANPDNWDQWIEFGPAALRVYSELKCTKELETLKSIILGIGEDQSPRSSIWALKGRVGMENKNLSFAESCFQKAHASAVGCAETQRALFGIGMGHILEAKLLMQTEYFLNSHLSQKIAKSK